ncbi:LANO_0H19372g1_1 [Lachancea nothofagi CBS 11611]|uniref:LANO_0H19372g1_1 n=1 Tax=Lachancea nothofagi CBS 11611 TaxID=1266666 RepID=A0A1G4KN43_9SACH|nr:LANO_0H19372g1_1 [Lachancea nothofagi CBS 11611]
MTTDDHNQGFQESSDFVETFKQLQEGEQTADKLEKMLDQLEGKLDELLSQASETSQTTNQKEPCEKIFSMNEDRKD